LSNQILLAEITRSSNTFDRRGKSCAEHLEVGIGPDAEGFSKAQVLFSVGHLADVVLHPIYKWNNPEPEILLAVDSEQGIRDHFDAVEPSILMP
jgi:hypothetical protein